MPRIQRTPKKTVTLTVDPDIYDHVRAAGVNISALLGLALENELRRIKAANWKSENREGLEDLNRFTEKHGLFSDQLTSSPP